MSQKKLNEFMDNAKAETERATAELIKAAAPLVSNAKENLQKAEEKVGPAVAKAKRAAKDMGKQAAAALCPEVYVQYAGQEYATAELVERCRADFKADNKAAIRSCAVYIKPEEGMVYYVINKTQGKLPL